MRRADRPTGALFASPSRSARRWGVCFASQRDSGKLGGKKQAAREARAETRRDKSADYARDKGLTISMEWDLDAIDQVATAPKFVRRFAVGNVEDFALEKGRERITIEVIREQMENAGVAKFMKFLKR